MLTTSGHRLPGAPGRLVTETAAWGALIVLAAVSYVVAGTSGMTVTLQDRPYSVIAEALGAGDFDNRLGSLSLLIVFVLAGAGLFLPARLFQAKGPGPRRIALSAAAVVLAALLIVLGFAPSAWLTWIGGLVLGALVGLLLSLNPFANAKPWRRVGVPAAFLVFLSCSFQILGGAVAGTAALKWMSLVVGVAMIVGAVIIYLTPERALHAEASMTGAFPEVKARLSRPPAKIANPWVCVALFAVLGTTVILSQPTAVENSFGQAGFALILVCSLLGWAIGFEMGPTFAPGMSRPRVSAFALTVSGILLIATGAIAELSGKVVLSAVIAFLVGIGVRSQPYRFSRRVGAVGGAVVALALNALDISAVVPLGATTEWEIAPSEVAYGVMGLAALIAGIIGLLIFDPHRLQGLAVDIVHGFRAPNGVGDAPGDGIRLPADRLGPGFFIAIEGGDGSGKSTQIKRISRILADEGYEVEATREPGGTELGRQIRSVLFDAETPAPRAEALLFAADRAHHVASLVDPSLDAGSIVITDRYIDSTVAYQAAGRQFDPETILALSKWATQGLIPHLTIVLDIEPEVAAARMGEREDNNYLDEENQQFHQRVRQTYLSRANEDPARYVVLDASVSEDELTGQILSAIHARLPREIGRGPAATGVDADAPAAAGAGDAAGSTAGTGAADGSGTVAGAGTGAGPVSAEDLSSTSADSTRTARFDAVAPDPAPAAEGSEDPSCESVDAPAGEATDDEPVAGDHATGDRAADEEAATTVLPAHGFRPSAPLPDGEDDEDDVPTTVIEERKRQEATPAEEADTTVLPAHAPRQSSRERLQAQAEIERQARERLRRQRERTQNRFNDPEGR
ncbi:dTMP kinase [Brevibacterium sanguinis]|uniref:Thymidylate kinase n=2 Tax=Brevibacterium TaxID=1696 RepID=A0A366IHS5_9MICO|nr:MULTISPECIES: dTMP kinase [Brevibacterium]RBP63381.1 dTMP kinase [Brevibacterium sanguinis]RBP69848.1 dTMP kinase [Brevibacterium celere]